MLFVDVIVYAIRREGGEENGSGDEAFFMSGSVIVHMCYMLGSVMKLVAICHA